MTVDKEKIRQKLHFMRENIKLLEENFKRMALDEFKNNSIYEPAATRMLQITIEAMLDICAHIIAREALGMPKTYKDIVQIAVKNDLIPNEMEKTFINMSKFRNRVVHLYNEIESEEILEIIKSHLDDFHPFMKNVVNKYFKN